MSKRRHPSAAFPSSLPRKGVALPVRHLPDGTAHCLPKVPGPVAPEYMRWLHDNVTECDLRWDGEGQCEGPLQIHHEPPKGMGGRSRDDRRVNALCRAHHDWRHGGNNGSMRLLPRGKHGPGLDVRVLLKSKQVEHLCAYLDQIGGGR